MSMGLDSDEFEELSNNFTRVMKEIENREEEYWNSLNHEQQLSCFDAVCRRIYKGEIEEKRSYRGVLYGIFNFTPEAYARAQMAGYLTIHNSIYDYEHEAEFLKRFAMTLGLSEEQAAEKVAKFITGERL